MSPSLLIHRFSDQQAGPVKELPEVTRAHHAEPIPGLLNQRHDIRNLQGDNL